MASAISFRESDGEVSHRPNTAIGYEKAPHDKEVEYRAKVGKIIAPKLDGYRPGMSYILKTLPDGYELWQKLRKATPSAKTHIDRYLYGHPNHYIFKSTNEFAPHALWLATGKEGRCTCEGCTGKRNKNTFIKQPASDTPKGARTPDLDTSIQGRVLRERILGTTPSKEPTFAKFLTDLKSEQELHVAIQDPENLAFKIEQKNYAPTIAMLADQGAFLPRVGELVLFSDMPTRKSQPFPLQALKEEWKAGLVTELPHPSTHPLTVDEITTPDIKKAGLAINYTGFRVETMTDPNSDRKDEQLQWSYLPLSALRPFNLHTEILSKTPRGKWHRSINNAMKTMSVLSLALPLKFVGRWPDAWFLYGGVFLGAEMLVAGDAVTIGPSDKSIDSHERNVLLVTAIVVAFKGLEADPPHYTRVTGDKCQGIELRLHGKFFTSSTTTSTTSSGEDQMDIDTDTSSLPPALRDPRTKYSPVSKNNTLHSVPFSRVLGRLYEPAALHAYDLPSHSPTHHSLANQPPTDQHCLTGIKTARIYAREHDDRIIALNQDLPPHQPKTEWFWANDRVEALGLHTFGELDVGEQWEQFIGRERMAYEG